MPNVTKSARGYRAKKPVENKLPSSNSQSDIPLEVLGSTMTENGNCTVLVARLGAPLGSALAIPAALLAVGKHTLLEEFLLKHGCLDITKTHTSRESSARERSSSLSPVLYSGTRQKGFSVMSNHTETANITEWCDSCTTS